MHVNYLVFFHPESPLGTQLGVAAVPRWPGHPLFTDLAGDILCPHFCPILVFSLLLKCLMLITGLVELSANKLDEFLHVASLSSPAHLCLHSHSLQHISGVSTRLLSKRTFGEQGRIIVSWLEETLGNS